MKARTIVVLDCACDTCRTGSGGCRDYPDGKIPVGTVREDPKVYRWVRHGVAVPADDECQQAAGMTPKQMEVAQHHQRRVRAGIVPEDFAAFDAGEMVGYYPDGTPIPGPNATRSEGGLILDGWDSES